MNRQERFLLTAIAAFMLEKSETARTLLSDALEAVVAVQTQENADNDTMLEWASK